MSVINDIFVVPLLSLCVCFSVFWGLLSCSDSAQHPCLFKTYESPTQRASISEYLLLFK